jgi:hypothetical protein
MIVGVENKGEISIQVAGKTGMKTTTKIMTAKTGMKMKMTINTITGLIQGTRMRTKKMMTTITMRILKTTKTNIRMEEDNTDDMKTMTTEEAVAEFREIIIGKRLTGTMIANPTIIAQGTIAAVPGVNDSVPHALALHIQNPGTPADNTATAKVASPAIIVATMGIPAVPVAAVMAVVVQVDSIVTVRVVLQATAVAVLVIHPAAVHPNIVHPAEIRPVEVHREEVLQMIIHREEVPHTTVHPVAVLLVTEVHQAEEAPPVQGAVLPVNLHRPFRFTDGPFFYF